MANFTPEQVLELQDPEIVQQIRENPDFGKYLSALQLEIYQDDTLADVRGTLMEEAINGNSIGREDQREKTYPLAFDNNQVIDVRVRALARVRCAIKREHPSITAITCERGKKEDLQDLLKKTKDGDLGYRYADENRDGGQYLGGKPTVNAISEWNLNFSPELQLRAVQGYSDILDKNWLIVDTLACSGQLSIEAWKALLTKDDGGTYRAVLNTEDTRWKILQLINGIEKFELLYRARTEFSAQEAVRRRADEFGGIDIDTWLEFNAKFGG